MFPLYEHCGKSAKIKDLIFYNICHNFFAN